MYKTISTLIGNTERTIFAWKREKRPIIKLFEKYFTKNDLEEFLEYGKIQKFESLSTYNKIVEKNIFTYLSFFFNGTYANSLKSFNSFFMDLYFRFLISVELRDYQYSLKDRLLQIFHNTELSEYELKKGSFYIKDMFESDFFAVLKDLHPLFYKKDLFILIEIFETMNLSSEEQKNKFNEALSHFIYFNLYKRYPQMDFSERNIIFVTFYDKYYLPDNKSCKHFIEDRENGCIKLKMSSFINLYKTLHNEDLRPLIDVYLNKYQ